MMHDSVFVCGLEKRNVSIMFFLLLADIIYKGNEYELTDSVMVSMECIGAVALSLFEKECR